MKINKYVKNYIKLYRSGKIKLNEERIQLIEYLERDVFTRDDIYFDDEMIENCIKFGEKWYFELTPTDKFLITFVFLLFKKNDRPFYRKHLWLVARGFGKNGKISVLVHFFISSLHGIDEYNVSLIANSEEQAMTSFNEVYNAIGRGQPLREMFKRTKTKISSKDTNATLQFRTSNGDTKDGLRDGAVVFDEIHRYQSNKDVAVHISGLGKKKNPREFYIGTDGYVRDGFLDDMKDLAKRVLEGEARVNAIFPFICKVDNEAEIHEPENWEKANPMLCHPRGEYAEELFATILEEYDNLLDDPSTLEEFLTKRMNLPKTDLQKSVATWEEIEAATAEDLPDLKGHECIGCLDFASIRDFAACGLLFRPEGRYVFKTFSFVRKEFADEFYGLSSTKKVSDAKRVNIPLKEWEREGLLKIVDEPTINIQHIVNYFVDARKLYKIRKIVIDNFRADLVRTALESAGFEIEVVRNPKAADALLAPRIETAFANREIMFGKNPLMRWYTNNVLVLIKKDGNKEYAKKEPVRRKTDGFDCFVTGMWRADEILATRVITKENIKRAIKTYSY